MSEIPVQNPFKFHKFWASKPLNIAFQYLDEHAGNRKVLLDPFAGSGVFIYAGLLKGLKAIYNDADPFALFLARNTIKPVDIEKLQDAYVHFLTRSIDRDITAGDKVIIPKGSTVEYIIRWFYESKCNICGSPVEVDYYIWDTEYEIAENDLKKISRDPRTSIFLSICRKKEDKWVFSQKDVTEKWRELVDKNPTVWLEKSKKKKIAASLVTLFSSQLVARNIAKRTQRKPVYKKFVCLNNPDHSRKPQPISEVDLEKIKLIERLDYPFPIPETELTYDINGKKVPFLTYKIRPRDIIYSKDEYEYLNTVSDKDFLYKEGSLIFLPKVKHYFTKRNLILASILFWSAIQEYDLELKEQLLLLFTSILHKLTKLESETQRWGANCYFILPNYVERNPLYVLSRSNRPYYRAFLDAKKSVNS